MYQHSCHNTLEASLKASKSREKWEVIKGQAARKKKAEEKYKEVRGVVISLGTCEKIGVASLDVWVWLMKW